jgi:transcriptional regulator with XRE-family HTH domain
MRTIGERIRLAREQRGMSQAELAAVVGFKAQSAIGNLENRATGRGGFHLPKIASALGVSVTWLLDGPDEPATVPWLEKSAGTTGTPEPAPLERGSADIETAIAVLRRLSPKAVKEALVFLDYLAVKHGTPSEVGADTPISAPARKAA